MTATSRSGARFSSTSDGLTRIVSSIASAAKRQNRPRARRHAPIASTSTAMPASEAIAHHGNSGAAAIV